MLLNDPDDAAGRLDALARGIDDALPRTVGAPEIGGRIGSSPIAPAGTPATG